MFIKCVIESDTRNLLNMTSFYETNIFFKNNNPTYILIEAKKSTTNFEINVLSGGMNLIKSVSCGTKYKHRSRIILSSASNELRCWISIPSPTAVAISAVCKSNQYNLTSNSHFANFSRKTAYTLKLTSDI